MLDALNPGDTVTATNTVTGLTAVFTTNTQASPPNYRCYLC